MALSDHLPTVVKMKVVVLTVDPTQRLVEVMGKDAAVIRIAIFNVPANFRWPKEGEYWMVRREGVHWLLDSPFQAEEPRVAIENLNPGDTTLGGGEGSKVVVDAEQVIDQDGKLYVKFDPDAITDGQILEWDAGDRVWIAVDRDTAGLATTFSTQIGNGSATTFVITHGLGTRKIVVSVRKTSSPYQKVEVDSQATTLNTATIGPFSTPPSSNQWEVTIIAKP